MGDGEIGPAFRESEGGKGGGGYGDSPSSLLRASDSIERAEPDLEGGTKARGASVETPLIAIEGDGDMLDG